MLKSFSAAAVSQNYRARYRRKSLAMMRNLACCEKIMQITKIALMAWCHPKTDSPRYPALLLLLLFSVELETCQTGGQLLPLLVYVYGNWLPFEGAD